MSSSKLSPIRLAAVAALIAGSASAQAQNLITNGSFELGSLSTTGFSLLGINDTTMTGWTVVTDDLAWFHTSFPPLAAQDGVKFLDLTSTTSNCLPCGGVQQTITTTVGQEYTLSFWLGSSSTFMTPSAITALVQGAVGSPISQTFTSTATGANNWERFSLNFVAANTATTVRLTGSFAQLDYVGLDNVSVVATAPIPEPGALAMMLAGLAAVGSVVSRRKLSA